MRVGVLALQGGFAEHILMLKGLGVEAYEVRLPKELDKLDGLIIPGGESTTISRLTHFWKLDEPIKKKAAKGMGIWGTCAGAILLAKQVNNLHPKGLQLMDITVERNAFGRQIESFLADLDFPNIGDEPFPAVFIRAPIITKVGSKVKTLVKLDDGTIVAVRQNKFLATSFHPELTKDNRIHDYFLRMLS